jgi:O-antigen/teichoic acid export membrane protein
MVGNAAAGNYSAGVRVAEVFYILPALIAQSVFPKLVESRSKSASIYFSFLQRMFFLFMWISIPISLLLASLSETIVSVLYGPAYVESVLVVKVLSITVVLNAIGVLSTKVLYVENYEQKYLARSILGVFVNLVLNLLLIPTYGIGGAAWATVGTLFFIFYIFDFLDKDLTKYIRLKTTCLYTFKYHPKNQ